MQTSSNSSNPSFGFVIVNKIFPLLALATANINSSAAFPYSESSVIRNNPGKNLYIILYFAL